MTNYIELVKQQNAKAKELAASKGIAVPKFAATDSVYYLVDEEDDSPFLTIVDKNGKPKGRFVSNDTEDGWKFIAASEKGLESYTEDAKKYPIAKLEGLKTSALKAFMKALGKEPAKAAKTTTSKSGDDPAVAKAVKSITSMIAKAAKAKNPAAKRNPDAFWGDITMITPNMPKDDKNEFWDILKSNKEFKAAASALKKAHKMDIMSYIKTTEEGLAQAVSARKKKQATVDTLATKVEKLKSDPKVQEYLSAIAELKKAKR